MRHDNDLELAGRLLARPQGTPPRPLPCTCADTVGITVRVAGGHLATLRSCQWCGDSWEIDSMPASREAVHALVPTARSPVWRCNRGRGSGARPAALHAPTSARRARSGAKPRQR